MRFALLIVFFFINLNARGQNLVPNPSFEDTVYCPFFANQMDACLHWKSYGNSPDYFNACTPVYGVPNQPFGYQYAHSGNAMAGICLYRRPNTPSGPNYREFIGIELNQPLIIGSKYFLSFYINFSYTLGIACNKAGLHLSTVPFDSCCKPPLLNNSFIYTDSIISDSLIWYKVSGSIVADSNYSYVMIGNFFTDSLTSIQNLITFPDAAYYYIDDVCVTTDSLYSQTWTGLRQIEKDKISIYPNPAIDFINVSTPSGNFYFEIYNHLGRVIKSGFLNGNNSAICIQELEPGLYFLRLRSQSIFISKPFLKLQQP